MMSRPVTLKSEAGRIWAVDLARAEKLEDENVLGQ